MMMMMMMMTKRRRRKRIEKKMRIPTVFAFALAFHYSKIDKCNVLTNLYVTPKSIQDYKSAIQRVQ